MACGGMGISIGTSTQSASSSSALDAAVDADAVEFSGRESAERDRKASLARVEATASG